LPGKTNLNGTHGSKGMNKGNTMVSDLDELTNIDNVTNIDNDKT